MTIHDLPTPSVLIDAGRLDGNIGAMQLACDAAGVQLWPHIKTHKLIPVLRQQLEAGAVGATFAKVGEAEALLPSGVRRIFIAHSLVQPTLAPRLRALREQVDSLAVAVTSTGQLDALERLLDRADISADALLAVDTGLSREGCRTPAEAAMLADRIRGSRRLKLTGLYSHEGHAYGTNPDDVCEFAKTIHARMVDFSEATGVPALWPGCSVTALHMAGLEQVVAIRPGAYVFGDLSLTDKTRVMPWERAALTVLASVVDRPTSDLALIDAGSKVFSSDKTPEGLSGRGLENREITVVRVNEEHGYVRFEDGGAPRIGEILRFVPAHVCPVLNLASAVVLVDGESVLEFWPVDARGCST